MTEKQESVEDLIRRGIENWPEYKKRQQELLLKKPSIWTRIKFWYLRISDKAYENRKG